jgi:hypothetical protein
VVLIDGPPLLPVAHAATIASCADGALVIVNDGGPVTEQEELARRLRLIGRSAIGYVYNHAPRARRAVPVVPFILRSQPEPVAMPGVDAPVELLATAHPASRVTEPTRVEHPQIRPGVAAVRGWRCSCGLENPATVDTCSRCGRPHAGRPQTAGG